MPIGWRIPAVAALACVAAASVEHAREANPALVSEQQSSRDDLLGAPVPSPGLPGLAAGAAAVLPRGAQSDAVGKSALESRGDPASAGNACRRVQALLDAQPQDWIPASAGIIARGKAAVPELLDGLQARPWSPGAQPAIALLGALGDPSAVPFLTATLRSDGPNAYEAALALGRLAAEGARPDLEATLRDHARAPLVRTACAAALLDLGERTLSVPFLHALFCVDTDAAGTDPSAQGLGSKPRWALERNVAIAAIARATGGETFGLDADAPWPRLTAAAARMRDRIGAKR